MTGDPREGTIVAYETTRARAEAAAATARSRWPDKEVVVVDGGALWQSKGGRWLVRVKTIGQGRRHHFADPGYQPDRKPRYPLDSETEVRAAWGYINRPRNARRYTSAQLAHIHQEIQRAGARYGIAYGHARRRGGLCAAAGRR